MGNNNSQRWHAIDAFRGITIAFMILVNTPGSWSYVYQPLKHADWHGCTPTDLVFPCFLFIVGISIYYSLKKGNNNRQVIYYKILKRTAVICGIGLLLHGFPYFNKDIENLRIMGVLQRIALAYCFSALLIQWLKPKQLIITSLFILLSYWLILWSFGSEQPYTMEGNIVREVDLWLLGANHMWQINGFPFDPEGILSTLPAIATCLIGYLTVYFINAKQTTKIQNCYYLFSYGALLTLLGYIWDNYFPINKYLWTSSYVLFTAGIAQIILALFIIAVDIKAWLKPVRPLLVFGANPLLSYILADLWARVLLFVIQIKDDESQITYDGYQNFYQTVFVPLAGHWNGSLLFACFHVLAIWAIMLIFYKKQIFFKA
ncbi:acyltransferase family protein [Spartinivicinus ruber]|uniref:acyltransferase family protein n=1 Tax=Spartinivicinus ruber TaxID=2683272 RepID=UPI0013D04D39|nr:heparan-alpha-glucosaminide N-acetyltransferase domain-containing protein [Spartinivicinus ruber]